MDHDNTTERLLFPELARKRVLIEFDDLKVSSDGGAVLLRAADARLGLTEAMASCLKDKRDGDRVQHEVAELVAQRVYAIACGRFNLNLILFQYSAANKRILNYLDQPVSPRARFPTG